MSITATDIQRVWIENDKIYIRTHAGEVRNHPLAWFPKLFRATSEERGNFEISPFGLHWPDLDEDLSFEGFFNYSYKAVH